MPRNSKSQNYHLSNAFSSQLIVRSWVMSTGFRKNNPFKSLITYTLFFGIFTIAVALHSAWTYYDISLPLSSPSSNVSSYHETSEFREFPEHATKWTAVISNGKIIASPVLVEDAIYVVVGRTSGEGRIQAMSSWDGSILWDHSLSGVSDFSPVVAEDVIFISLRSGLLVALDRHNGKELWSFQAESFINGPPIVEDGVIYLAAVKIYALDAVTGEVRWTRKAPKDVSSHLALSQGVLAFVGFDGVLRLFDADKGKPKFEYPIWFPFSDQLLASKSLLIVTGGGANIHAIDIRSVDIPYERAMRTVWERLWLWGMAPSPTVPRGYLWHNGTLQGVEAKAFVADGNFVYVGIEDAKVPDSSGQIVALDLSDGQVRWRTFLDSFPISAHLVGQEGLLVATSAGHLHFLSKSSGFQSHHVELGLKLVAPPGLGHNQLVVADNSGTIRSLK